MDPLVRYLVDGLRLRGVPVSPAEAIDAHRALALVGVVDRGHCVAALRATLVKHAVHDRVFDALLVSLGDRFDGGAFDADAWFTDLAAALEFDGGADDASGSSDDPERIRVADGRDELDDDGEIGIATDSAIGTTIGIDGVELVDTGDEANADPRGRRLVVGRRSQGTDEMSIHDRLSIERAARSFLRRHRRDARRRGPSPTGRLDVRATQRAARRTGGVPLTLQRRNRTRRGSRVFVLADVSVSVRPTATLALHTADALARRSRAVRLHVFVDEAVDVTSVVRRLPPDLAVVELVDGGLVDVGAASDYGRALRSAHDRIGAWLHRSTTVVVFGDGRSNGADPGFEVTERWARTASVLLWCTPEPQGAWPLGPGEMQGYAERVTAAHTLRTVDDVLVALAH